MQNRAKIAILALESSFILLKKLFKLIERTLQKKILFSSTKNKIDRMTKMNEFDSIFSLFFHKIHGTIADFITWGNKLWRFHSIS